MDGNKINRESGYLCGIEAGGVFFGGKYRGVGSRFLPLFPNSGKVMRTIGMVVGEGEVCYGRGLAQMAVERFGMGDTGKEKYISCMRGQGCCVCVEGYGGSVFDRGEEQGLAVSHAAEAGADAALLFGGEIAWAFRDDDCIGPPCAGAVFAEIAKGKYAVVVERLGTGGEQEQQVGAGLSVLKHVIEQEQVYIGVVFSYE